MIYLDYAANTPVDPEVMNIFCEVSTSYMANPNASHQLGKQAREKLDTSTKEIATLLGVNPSEIVYTSGATEANNLAIKGIANAYKKYGKHIITTYLEHSSVTGSITSLQNLGYEVEFVNLLANGLIDLNHLKELIREDTILVSIAYVDSELGIKQPVREIGEILSEYKKCFFHVDATQAVGKIPIDLELVDLATFTGHKFYGLDGCGVLIKKDTILLAPIIHGGIGATSYRSGSPTLALIVATSKALSLAQLALEERYLSVQALNKKLREKLIQYPRVAINSSKEAIPYILNFSVHGVKSSVFQSELEKHEVYLSTKSACSTPNTPSRSVQVLTKDRKLALSALRISLSHLTTEEDIDNFCTYFDKCYNNLVN